MQKVLAIIPARGGSKGLIKKNLRLCAGKPLIAYTIEAARDAECVNRVVVSTDDAEIAKVALGYGGEVLERPADISGDRASSETALSHVLDHLANHDQYEPDLVVFLQCTSPIREPDDIDKAVEMLLANNADSLLTVAPSHRFLWRKEDDKVKPVNYDYLNRPRRQDRLPEFSENGSIYIFRPWVLRDHNNRLGGKIVFHEMDYWSSFEIDSQEDLALCEWIIQRRRQKTAKILSREVRLVVFDFDGVFTDNRVIVFQDGTEAVVCNRGDGYGLNQLKESGVEIIVLSKEANPVVSKRCDKLQLECHQGIDDKKTLLTETMRNRDLQSDQVIFVGNDLNDLECMRMAGVGIAPVDAHPKVLAEVFFSKVHQI